MLSLCWQEFCISVVQVQVADWSVRLLVIAVPNSQRSVCGPLPGLLYLLQMSFWVELPSFHTEMLPLPSSLWRTLRSWPSVWARSELWSMVPQVLPQASPWRWTVQCVFQLWTPTLLPSRERRSDWKVLQVLEIGVHGTSSLIAFLFTLYLFEISKYRVWILKAFDWLIDWLVFARFVFIVVTSTSDKTK